MQCTGAYILLESLKREGVDVLFGYPGGAVIDIYDEMPKKFAISLPGMSRGLFMRRTAMRGHREKQGPAS
jgi:glyoxylate carboligase